MFVFLSFSSLLVEFLLEAEWLLEEMIVVYFSLVVSKARRCFIRVNVKDEGGEAEVS